MVALNHKSPPGTRSQTPEWTRDSLDLTPEQQAALLQSVAEGEAQYAAGEAIPGDDVTAWLRSWGTKDELPPPGRKA